MPQDASTPSVASGAATHLGPAGSETAKTVGQWTQTAVNYGVEFGPRILGVLVVLLIAWIGAGWLRRIVLAGLTKARFDLTLAKFFANMSRWIVLALGVLACFETFGIKSTSVAAMVGAVGLAIALGFQGSLGNLAAGVLLLVFRPFKIGDNVIVAGQTGVVDGIDLFTTNLDTVDYRRVIIPNGAIFNAIIENTSHHPRRAVTVNAPVAATAELDRTREVLMGAAERAASSPGGLRTPAPAVVLNDIAPGVVWSVTVWAETASYVVVRQALLREIKLAVDGASMAPPPPATNVHVQRAPRA